ncbi:MAG: SpoIIE family protein phosphatase [Spirochaetes bacterium]|nr:SpoIIE family protein phosphatase [Spirochaetota bacterium]
MSILAGFSITEKIAENRKSAIYRAVRDEDGLCVVLKVMSKARPSPADIARYKKEYEIIRGMKIEGVIATYGLVEDRGRIALVLEDFRGLSLKDYLRSHRPGLEQALEMVISIADTLSHIHGRNIIHRDIKPHNILYNPESGEVKVTDFGISMLLPREQADIYDPGIITGTLPYMSPEQTGRISRPVDYRTDLYSLGATMYELFAGRVPFTSTDPLEILYDHLAREPERPSVVNPGIPEPVSDIIMKLLSKDVDGRYRNCAGLRADLDECLQRVRAGGEVSPFELARHDVSERLSVSGSFVGRKNELAHLVESFSRVSQGGCEAVVISGPPGIGKTSFVNRIEGEVIARKGHFISGRYEAVRMNTPYSAIIHAFKKLILRILTEGPERVGRWKETILSALGDNCRVIIDVIPELEMIVEIHPELPEIVSEKTLNRFMKVFKDFVRIFSTGEHPLVLFLDDLHFADLASLSLLAGLMGGIESRHLMLILSYRDTEVGPGHPIHGMLEEMGDRVSRIDMVPLSKGQFGELLGDMMKIDSGDCGDLAEQLHRKTEGNPFFLINCIRSMCDSGLLGYSPLGWRWDLREIMAMKVSENVAELMASKIMGLPPGTRAIMRLASCVGNRVDIESLAVLSGREITDVLSDIQEAVNQGYMFHEGRHYHFAHDRIQEILYSMIDPRERTEIHYRIGTLILEKAGEGELTEKIYYVAHHLNAGAALMGPRDERVRLSKINLAAGRKAKDSTAYAEASGYFGKGIALLDDASWEREYSLAWDLHFDMAETEYLKGNFTVASSLFDEVMRHSPDLIDRARIYDRLIVMYTNMGEHGRGVELGIEALRLFGIWIPRKVRRASILKEIAKAKILLGRRRIADLVDSPVVEDPATVMAMTICMDTGTAAYFVDNNIVALLAMKLVNMSLKKGNTRISSFAYLSFGLILGYGMGFYETALSFGELALKLNAVFNNVDLTPRILFIYGFLISHWRRHYSESLRLLRESYRVGVETGDLNYAVYSAVNLIQYRIWTGDNLDHVLQELSGFADFVHRTRNEEFIDEFILARQYILSQKGRTKSLSDYGDETFEEDAFVEKIARYRVTTHSYSVFKMASLYLDRKYREALELAERVRDSIGEVLYAQTNVAVFNLFHSLILAALYRESGRRARLRISAAIARNQAAMRRWSLQCPDNYRHGYLLVEAERAAMKGKESRAVRLYDEAIRSARESGFTRIAAVACARAGEFCNYRGRDILAGAYIAESINLFSRHGSTAVVEKLERVYPDYTRAHAVSSIRSDTSEHSTGSSGAMAFDMATLLKTTQIISSEIVLEKLLKKLVMVIGESAAATNGAMILEKDGKLVIEASGDIVAGRITVLQSQPIESSSEISSAIVHYVARTRENLVLNDASNVGLFINDPHVIRSRCKSVLCIPVMHQGKLSAIFYAENNLTVHAFTEERIELLKTIASYAAVSVDNARLYSNLEEKVTERTRALEFAYDQVTEAYRIIQEDISLARRIQENLLTYELDRDSPFNIDIHFYPMSEVGGDLYDIVEIRPGVLRVFLADATGHGIQGALVTMLVKSEYGKFKYEDIPPSEIMKAINNEFIGRYTNLPVLYTCIIADIDMHAGRVTYASAGHPDQYVLHDGDVSVLSRTGKIIGFVRGLEYKLGEAPFGPRDKLILFSDGIYEEFDMDLREYGEKRLLDLVKRHSREPIATITRHILDDVRSFTGKERINMSDDVTVLGVEIRGNR